MVEGLFITRHALYTLHITHCTESLSMANVEYRIAYNQHPLAIKGRMVEYMLGCGTRIKCRVSCNAA